MTTQDSDSPADHAAVILTYREWRHALQELSLDSSDDMPGAACDRARELNALLMLAPDDALVDGLLPLRSARLQAFLEVDAPEAAIIAMLDHGSGYMLSYGGYEQALATIALPRHREMSCAGKTAA